MVEGIKQLEGMSPLLAANQLMVELVAPLSLSQVKAV